MNIAILIDAENVLAAHADQIFEHAAALGDTLGLFFILLGMLVANGLDLNAVKYLMLIFLLWNTSPIASHLIGKLEIETNENLAREVVSWKR